MSKFKSAHEALSLVKSGQRVFIHGGVATPESLVQAMVEHSPRLKDVEIMHLHTEAAAPYAKKEFAKSFRVTNLFVGANVRKEFDFDRVDYLPCFLSEIPGLFRSGIRTPDVALIQVSPPDRHGFVSLGTSVDVARAAVDTAKILIAQINPQMPRVHGDSLIPIDRIQAYIELDTPLKEVPPHQLTEVELSIGRHIADLVEDGSTLQLGIGAIPDAVAKGLKGRKNLGIHSEMWSDGVLDLILSGAVDNSRKKIHRGKVVSSFVIGTRKLYDFINDNPFVLQLGADEVNNPGIILRNPKVVAVNSAVQVDLTGQVCADSVGTRIISGVGGQVDFMRGASFSEGGKPIIAIGSRSAKGHSKIVAQLTPGSGVVTTRPHVHWVVTEHGAVNLYGKSLHERAKALISIAHPDTREGLQKEWHALTHRV